MLYPNFDRARILPESLLHVIYLCYESFYCIQYRERKQLIIFFFFFQVSDFFFFLKIRHVVM